jgi:hypothetical protein
MDSSKTNKDDTSQNGASAMDAVKGRVEDLKGNVGDAVDTMKHNVGEATSQMRDKLPSPDQMRAAVTDNSLALVGGAFALGLLTGLVIPISSVERSSIGPLRDALVDRASDVAADVVEHGKQVIAETATAAANAAREHGREVIADAQRGD